MRIPGKPIGMPPNRDLMAHSICRWIDDENVPCASGRRDDEVVFWTTEHPACFGAVFDGGEMRQGSSVDNFYGAARRVCHEHVTAWLVNVPVVETAVVPVRWQ